MKPWLASSIALTGLFAALPAAAKECPPEITAAVLKAHSGATVVACKQEVERRTDQRRQHEIRQILGSLDWRTALTLCPQVTP